MIRKIIKKARVPVILLFFLLTAMLSFILTSSLRKNMNERSLAGSYTSAAVNDAADVLCCELTSCPAGTSELRTTVKTTAVTTVSATTIVTTSDNALAPDRYVGTSPNSAFYQERLFTAGDSIALGLKYYGFIPIEHSIAGDSVSMWNLAHFTFTMGTEELGLVDAVEYAKPKLLYMWLGMNDVNLNSPGKFIKRYREVIDEIRERVPGINIIVAAITPVGSGCRVVKNSIIRDYNAALIEMVKRIDSPDVYFFDDYSVICDDKLELTSGYSSGDGMHLYIPCYTDIMTALFDYLDTTDIKVKLETN
ncbi:MAG: SGNH/GDSL hydrolase family protein [Ruminococcus sp.]|uniref:SGNH/GDSL hydrolase family protein n=1 Tax=Ruminococcus sp. TaxID=41978 RepID=UPI001B5E976C|nr:SGNH/GDSL hydrolase family protein [Ruminococcus sp.]MBO4492994.1 SGNH/GDSL hydrolase family protein [Ruminococcus sp.]MBP5431506.1 SGNH/GDSL hydrolase family protein [Ruminococcus sp.]